MERYLRRKFERKLGLVFLLFVVSLFLSGVRALDLQITKESEAAKKIEESFSRTYIVKIPLYRGSLRDRNGKELALSVPTLTLYAHPNTRLIRNRRAFLQRLSSLSGVSVSVLEDRLREGQDRPITILTGLARDLEDELLRLIRETKNTRFIGVQRSYRRLYPNGSLASNLLGFVGTDGVGLEGMEYKLNDYLGGGHTQAILYFGGELGTVYLKPAGGLPGDEHDVYLTLDVGVQSILEAVRDDIVKRWKPKRVSILLMDVRTGEILGLATYPYFDPNTFYKYPPQSRRNFAVTDVFEPGSIMKPFFVGYALEKGYVSAGSVVDTGDGRIRVHDRYVRDPKRFSRLRLEDVLVHSSNVGTIKVASFLSRKEAEDLLRRFHLHARFGVFPGEAAPKLPDFRYPANILYSSIGQGIAMNSINIAVAFGALATGDVVKPKVVKEILSPDGKKAYSMEVEVLKKDVFSKKTIRWLREALTKVVERGTGRRARSKFFTIAGKTGTSQKFDPALGRYSREKVVTYFAGFFPATKPRFVGVIVVDEPKGKRLFGGEVCAPYFKKIVELVAFYYGLKPDKVK